MKNSKLSALKDNTVVRNVTKFFRIYYIFQKQNLAKLLSYRLSFILSSLWLFIWLFIDIFFFQSLFNITDSIAGWSYWDAILLTLAMSIFWDIYWRVTSGGLLRMSQTISNGTIDQYLLKPFNEILLIDFANMSTNRSLNTVTIAIYYFINNGFNFTLGQIAIFILQIFLAVGIFSWIFIIISSLAFWITDTYMLESSYWQLLNIARYPKDIFQGLFSLIFTFIMPVFLVSNIPVNTLRSGLDVYPLLIGITLNIILGTATILIWRKGLKKYSGVSK